MHLLFILACNTAIGAGSGSRDIPRHDNDSPTETPKKPTRDELKQILRTIIHGRSTVFSSDRNMACRLSPQASQDQYKRIANKLDKCKQDKECHEKTIAELLKLPSTEKTSKAIEQKRRMIENLNKELQDLQHQLDKIPEDMRL